MRNIILALILFVMLAIKVVVVYQIRLQYQHQDRAANELSRTRAELELLHTEQATLVTPERIEKLISDKLKLHAPSPSDTVIGSGE